LKDLKIEGIIPPMATPLDENQQISKQGIQKLTDFLIQGGVHGLFVLGSLGEFYAFSPEEKKLILETVLERNRGKVPVFAGTGAPTTREVIKLTTMAEEVGADGVAIVTPFYIKPSQEEVITHYRQIADSTSLPVIIYHNPGRTGGLTLSPTSVRELSQIENIKGIIDASGDINFILGYLRQTESDFAVLAGQDPLILSALILGAPGAVAATANIVPQVVVDMYNNFKEGNFELALEEQKKIASLRDTFTLASFPSVVKQILNLLDIPAGPPRSPVEPLDAGQKSRLVQVLKSLNLTLSGQ